MTRWKEVRQRYNARGRFSGGIVSLLMKSLFELFDWFLGFYTWSSRDVTYPCCRTAIFFVVVIASEGAKVLYRYEVQYYVY